MDTLYAQQMLMAHRFGEMFVLLAAIFALGSVPNFAPRFYPDSPSFWRRLAAPLIFAGLAAACFLGAVMPALCVTGILGMILIVISRRTRRKQIPTE